jgi:hypothetical protein
MIRRLVFLALVLCQLNITQSANPTRNNMAFIRGPASFLRLRRNAVCNLRCSTDTAEGKNGIANKVALVALGCPKNTVDAEVPSKPRLMPACDARGSRHRIPDFCLSQVMLGDLQKRGFSIVRQPAGAS